MPSFLLLLPSDRAADEVPALTRLLLDFLPADTTLNPCSAAFGTFNWDSSFFMLLELDTSICWTTVLRPGSAFYSVTVDLPFLPGSTCEIIAPLFSSNLCSLSIFLLSSNSFVFSLILRFSTQFRAISRMNLFFSICI